MCTRILRDRSTPLLLSLFPSPAASLEQYLGAQRCWPAEAGGGTSRGTALGGWYEPTPAEGLSQYVGESSYKSPHCFSPKHVYSWQCNDGPSCLRSLKCRGGCPRPRPQHGHRMWSTIFLHPSCARLPL